MEGYAALASEEGGAVAEEQAREVRRRDRGRESRSGSVSKGIKSVHDFIQSTKSWMFDDANAGAETKQGSSELRTINASNKGIVTVVAEEVIPTIERNHNIYRVLEVQVPFGVSRGEYFTIALPTGENREVVLPDEIHQDRVLVCYDLIEEEPVSRQDNGPTDEERLLRLYKIHRPVEREAVLIKGVHGFGLTTFQGEFGVHVHHAVFAGVESMLKADDIIVSIDGQPVSSQEQMQAITAPVEVGHAITLGLLRKSPPLTQKCPQGRTLTKVTFKDPLPSGLTCRHCNEAVWNMPTVYVCEECEWTLCRACFKTLNERFYSDEIANSVAPKWADDVEEAFGVRLENGFEDIGRKIKIYSQFTGEWWLGEVADYDAEHGHTIVYEEGDRLSKEVVKHMKQREYRVMKNKPSNDTQTTERPTVQGEELLL